MRLEYSISNIVLTGDLVKEGTLGEVVVDALTRSVRLTIFLLSESYCLNQVNISESFVVEWHNKEDERCSKVWGFNASFRL
jgi:hypothetical protein